MPFNVTVSPLRSRVPLSPLPTGGYSRVSTPNPNSGMATYRRNNPNSQPVGASAMPTASADPFVQRSASGDALGIGVQQRGVQAYQQAAAEHDRDAANRGVAVMNTVLPDPKWQGLLQALFEADANHVTTGAARGWDQPGHFDTQMSPQDELMAQLRAQDAPSTARMNTAIKNANDTLTKYGYPRLK